MYGTLLGILAVCNRGECVSQAPPNQPTKCDPRVMQPKKTHSYKCCKKKPEKCKDRLSWGRKEKADYNQSSNRALPIADPPII